MFAKSLTQAVLLACLAVSSVHAAVPQISIKGTKFFYSNGTQYYMKGIAYQLTPADPLIDTEQCQRDASLMGQLGANAIRVYHVDPEGDHTGCMTAFANAGIYLLVDLDTFETDIDPGNASWNKTQFDAFAAVMDAFHTYDNTLGFFIGNEVIALNNQSLAAPYIKASARDMKSYRDSKGYRKIPVGYSAADIAELRPMLQDYLACGTNASEAIDFFGLNAYEWCGPNDMKTSGYNNLNAFAENLNIPIFFSETGCNTVRPRDFQDQGAILGPDMNEIWSGAIIYEWIEEANNYGLVSYGAPVPPTVVATDVEGGFTRRGKPTPVVPDFMNLQKTWATLHPKGVASSDYTPTITPPACPSSTPGGWLVNGNVPLPSLGQALQTGTPTTGTQTGSATGSSASASRTTKGGANGGKEIAGCSVGLVAVMLGFMFYA
ncbi:hypothetical protein WAI453_009860 [Rhynchosporium graminicola]|uniref:1,3-beta-glucanosyltransferase n=1 Tax=Rhynchosporium graminicola TaxID=2792576 RepID=A0A1E1KE23_9HELO|nr:related to beta (1-3) glucanosyltransferase [Rhynchosporium commune]